MYTSKPRVRARSTYYEGLRNELLNRLLKERPGERLPGDRDLARELGTSKITVGHILQELQSEGLLERIPGKGTFLLEAIRERQDEDAQSAPDSAARERSAGDTRSLHQTPQLNRLATQNLSVLILAVLTHPWAEVPLETSFARRIISRMERELQMLGAKTTVRNQYGVAAEDIEAVLRASLQSGVNRLVYMPQPLPSRELDAAWEDALLRLCTSDEYRHVSVVQIADDVEPYLPFDTVGVQGEQGAYLATKHLLDRGHRNIAFVAPNPQTPALVGGWVIHRIRGFRRALQMAGIDPPILLGNNDQVRDSPRIIYADMPEPHAGKWSEVGLSAWPHLARRKDVTGVVVANDMMALSLIKAARQDGVQVPEDLSVVGYDDYFLSPEFDLTTLHVPADEIGSAVVQLLARTAPFVTGARHQIAFDPILVVRGSTTRRV